MFWKKASPEGKQPAAADETQQARPASSTMDKEQLAKARQERAALEEANIVGGSLAKASTLTLDEKIKSFSNQGHIKADWVCSALAYLFGSAMHVTGQSTALVTLSMWMSGTTYLMNAQMRTVYGPTKDIYQLEAVASWIWMLSSFQQFRQVKTLKYAGYSSWTGLAFATYFSFQHLTNLMLFEE